MSAFLTTHRFGPKLRATFDQLTAELGLTFEVIELPAGGGLRLSPEELASFEIAFYPGDFTSDAALSRSFLGSALRAPNLRWIQLPNAGVDDPVFGRLRDQGVRLTNSSGAAAEPIAQTAIGGMIALARGFPRWWDAQRRHSWEPHNIAAPPRDLRGQTIVVVGLGSIGREIARLARALGLHVIGVRRSPRKPDDPDELVSPDALNEVLPRADWLAIACPLTDGTRNLIDARALQRLPHGARVINVARGEVIDEAALIAALRAGRVGGAYLDVFAVEPLAADSPLWDLPGVIVSPHDSSPSAGNIARQADVFFRNLARFARGEALENEV